MVALSNSLVKFKLFKFEFEQVNIPRNNFLTQNLQNNYVLAGDIIGILQKNY